MDRPLRGGGGKGRAIKEKMRWLISSRGIAFMVWPLVKELILPLPIAILIINLYKTAGLFLSVGSEFSFLLRVESRSSQFHLGSET